MAETKEPKILYKRLTVEEQAELLNKNQPFLYRMKIRFKADAGINEINNILAQLGDEGKMLSRNAVTLTMEQTVPFVPDGTTLEHYAKVLQEGYSQKNVTLYNARFDGYEYLHAVVPYMETESGDAVHTDEEDDTEE